MDMQIVKKNGETFTLEHYDVIMKDFIVSSIPLESIYGKVEGGNRRIDYGATFGIRTISVPLEIKAHDLIDFPLLRDLLFGLMSNQESFYVRELRRVKKRAYNFVDTNESASMNNDTNNMLVGGKQYLVRLQNSFTLEQIENYGQTDLQFETTELPYAESIGTTQEIEQNGIDAEDDLWSYGMGLIDDPDSLIYTHTTRTFSIYNAGNVPIHPFEQDLKITIEGINVDEFTLTNLTNGTEFKVTESVSDNQTIVIDGANVTSNGLAFLRSTNKQFIELEPGWNEFEVSTDATVSFDFRFYYN